MKNSNFRKAIILSAIFGTSLSAGIVDDIIGNIGGNGSVKAKDSEIEFGIPGYDGVKLTCGKPSFSFDGNLDFCDVTNKLTDSIPKFKMPDLKMGKCGNIFSSTDLGCNNIDLKAMCDKSTKGAMDKNLGKLTRGIGGTQKISSRQMALFGGKSSFGEDLCANSAKRYKAFSDGTLKNIYSMDGSLGKMSAQGDKSSDTYVNTRKGAAYLRCLEAAGGDESKCSVDGSSLSGTSMTASQMDQEISGTGKKAMVSASADTMGRVADYAPMFQAAAKKWGIDDYKILIAIGLQESKLRAGARGAVNSNGSADFGLMQINNKAHGGNIQKRYAKQGGAMAAVDVPEIAIDYGAYVLKKTCMDKSSRYVSNMDEAINCYNKGAGNAKKNWDGYVKHVKAWYAKITGKDLDGGGSGLEMREIKADQRSCMLSTTSTCATQRRRTLTHTGQDYIDKLPREKRSAYIQMVNRWMAQETIIKSSNKKANDIEKALLALRSQLSSPNSALVKDSKTTGD